MLELDVPEGNLNTILGTIEKQAVEKKQAAKQEAEKKRVAKEALDKKKAKKKQAEAEKSKRYTLNMENLDTQKIAVIKLTMVLPCT